MISCNFGKLKIQGNPAIICTELEDILRALEKLFADSYESKELAREMIDSIVANSRKTNEEIEKEFSAIPKSDKDKARHYLIKTLLEAMEEEGNE